MDKKIVFEFTFLGKGSKSFDVPENFDCNKYSDHDLYDILRANYDFEEPCCIIRDGEASPDITVYGAEYITFVSFETIKEFDQHGRCNILYLDRVD